MRHLLACWLLIAFVAQAATLDDLAAARLHALALRLAPLHTPMGPPEPGDWLEAHEEAGQTFAQWRAAPRNVPTAKRRTICLQPLGAFDDARAFLVADTVAFLGAFFQLPVRLQPVLDLGEPPARARRVNPATRRMQWRTDGSCSSCAPTVPTTRSRCSA
ncbi:MAG: hypothetical protein H0W72_02840 [Planctomycetes bacterium]|nr:hypothetical protein [Planctomycetota bacterium]